MVIDRVKCCVEDTDSMDELIVKHKKYIATILQNSIHKYAANSAAKTT